ncbi:MAG: nucleotidyltransferase family protein [Geothermobacteraceae bacterium]
MACGDIRTLLARKMDELAAFHVRSLAIFGSVARGEDRPDSDVDLLVEFDKCPGMFEFLRLKFYLEELLGRPVDLVTPDALKPQLKQRILDESVHV